MDHLLKNFKKDLPLSEAEWCAGTLYRDCLSLFPYPGFFFSSLGMCNPCKVNDGFLIALNVYFCHTNCSFVYVMCITITLLAVFSYFDFLYFV